MLPRWLVRQRLGVSLRDQYHRLGRAASSLFDFLLRASETLLCLGRPLRNTRPAVGSHEDKKPPDKVPEHDAGRDPHRQNSEKKDEQAQECA